MNHDAITLMHNPCLEKWISLIEYNLPLGKR